MKQSKIKKEKVQALLMEELVQLLHKIEQKLNVKIKVVISCNSEIITSTEFTPIILPKKYGKNKTK
jgi:hypothetical protein